jgi:hypothetical protein
MSTLTAGLFYSNQTVGEKAEVSEDFRIIAPYGSPFANSIGAFESSKVGYNRVHQWVDDVYIPLYTTLAVAINAAAVTVVLTDEVCKVGEQLEIEGEIMTITARPAANTFTVTRSTGTLAAAAHAILSPVKVLPIGEAEGSASGANDITREPRPKTAQMQTFRRVIEASDISNKAQRYGRPGTKYDDDAETKMKEILMLIDAAFLKGVAVVGVGTTGVGGRCAGAFETILAVNTMNMAGTDFTPAKLRTAVSTVENYYDDAEVPAVLLVPNTQQHVFNGWQQAHMVDDQNDEQLKTYGVRQVYRLNSGKMLIDVITTNRFDNTGLLYRPDYIDAVWMEKPYHEKLPRVGIAERGHIVATGTIETACPESGVAFTNLL